MPKLSVKHVTSQNSVLVRDRTKEDSGVCHGVIVWNVEQLRCKYPRKSQRLFFPCLDRMTQDLEDRFSGVEAGLLDELIHDKVINTFAQLSDRQHSLSVCL